MDDKLSKESFKHYRNWQRYIRSAKPKLSTGLVKSTLVAYCLCMASDGANGIGCFTSDARIASDLGLYDARSVRPYRHEAIRLGWFVLTGEHKGRVKVLDIAIPENGETAAQEHFTGAGKMVAHDRTTSPAMCAACDQYRRPVANGDMTVAEVLEIHLG